MYDTQLHSFTIRRGGNFDPSLTLRADDQAFSLAGWDVHFVIVGSVDLTRGSGLTIDDAAGHIAINVTPSQTQAMKPRSRHYYLELTDPTGETGYPLAGAIQVIDP